MINLGSLGMTEKELIEKIDATPGKREEFLKGWLREIEQYLEEYRDDYPDIVERVHCDLFSGERQ